MFVLLFNLNVFHTRYKYKITNMKTPSGKHSFHRFSIGKTATKDRQSKLLLNSGLKDEPAFA